MSELQKAAKPLLHPILAGNIQTLLPADAQIVARWAAMTACSFEYLNGYGFIGRGEHDTIKAGHCPSRWIVALGRADNLGIDHHVRSAEIQSGNSGFKISNMIFVINKVAFFVAAIKGPARFNHQLNHVRRVLQNLGAYVIAPHDSPAPSQMFEITESPELQMIQGAIFARLLRTKQNPEYVPPRPGYLDLSDYEWQFRVSDMANDVSKTLISQMAHRASIQGKIMSMEAYRVVDR